MLAVSNCQVSVKEANVNYAKYITVLNVLNSHCWFSDA